MNRKTLLGLLFTVSLLATMALLLAPRGPLQSPATEAPFEQASSADPGHTPSPGLKRSERGPRPRSVRDALAAIGQRDAASDDELVDSIVEMLRLLYGDRISETTVQARLFEVRQQILALFPKQGHKRFREILRQAFPGHVNEILATLAKIDEYNRWLAESESELAELTPLEQQQAALDKKKELFGETAAAEFAREALEHEERNETMRETMLALEESEDTDIDGKLDVYVDALNENYGGAQDAWTLENSALIAGTFFALESVRRQLAAMDARARQEKINSIRRELGYSEEQIDSQQERDEYRNGRWENGYAYMDERAQVVGRYSGQRLERELASLRERYFAHEARTIELEEHDGFFRFERPRLHGRN